MMKTRRLEVVLPAEFDQVSDEVGGELILTFYLPNIYDFRNFVDNHEQCFYGCFLLRVRLFVMGVFCVLNYPLKKSCLTVYEEAMVRLDQAEPFTGVFDEIPANDILK